VYKKKGGLDFVKNSLGESPSAKNQDEEEKFHLVDNLRKQPANLLVRTSNIIFKTNK